MEVDVGLRVVRGPDWSWGDQDGGEGHVGTVVEVGQDGRSVVVQWDCGNRCRYRCGEEGKHDLRVFDSAPAGLVHSQLRCHGCLVDGIAGMLWKCVKCLEYHLCTTCYTAGKHSVEHPFHRIDVENLTERTRVPPRSVSFQVEARGIFPGAKVVRGHDWRWGSQDGGLGMVGKVVSIQAWQKESARSVASIEWTGIHRKNLYRVGHKGKVDVKCIESGRGGQYYPLHLPILGAPHEPPSELEFATGDRVKVELDPDVWSLMQDGHGGWNDLMSMFIGMIGTVISIDDDGDLLVNFMSNALFHVNPAAVTKVDTPVFQTGDVVFVMEDCAEVRKLQKGHGEWIEQMTASLGQLGRVVNVLPNGDSHVSVAGRRWTFNAACLKPAPGENPSTDLDTNEDYVDPGIHIQLQYLLEKMSPEVVPMAAMAGDASILREFLAKCPNDVNALQDGRPALHFAISSGYMHILKILLEYKPNLDLGDDNGETPLHICAHFNQDDAAKLLLDAGADVNCKNAVGIFPLTLCTALGNYRVLRLFANHPKVNLHNQDIDGNTALHVAVQQHRNEGVIILLDAGADPTLYNSMCFSPILEAAKNGFYAGMEQFMARVPEHVNMIKIDDGHTALHIAAANDHSDLVRLLASVSTCDLNARNHLRLLTPLHLAVEREHSRIVEALVGHGADVNLACSDGRTPLHVVTKEQVMEKPTTQTPQLQKVSDQLVALNDGKPVEPYVVVAAFLVQEGADVQIKSSRGVNPLLVCPPDIVALITKFASENLQSKAFHGTLRSSSIQSVIKAPTLPTGSPSVPKSVSSDVLGHQGKPEASAIKPSSETTQDIKTPKQPQGGGSLQQAMDAPPNVEALTSPPATTAVRPIGISSSIYTAPRSSTDRNTPPAITAPIVSSQTCDGTGHISTAEEQAQDELCVLCENPADIKFEPCGHITMCSDCADRAKRCPICKGQVKSKIKKP